GHTRLVSDWSSDVCSSDLKLFAIRADPFEKAPEEGLGYKDWRFHRVFLLGPAQAYVGKWLETFKDYPPRQKPGSFNLSEVMEKLTRNAGQENVPPVDDEGGRTPRPPFRSPI